MTTANETAFANCYFPVCCINPSQPSMYLTILIICLIGSQMMMLVATKRVISIAPFPLLLCEAQFLVSCVSAGGLLLIWKCCSSAKARATSSTSWTFYLPLSLSWTLGFVLFNASATFMSPSLVNLIRCGEPMATVLVGWIVFGKSYAGQVLITLIPVLGGVCLAAAGGAAELSLSWKGIGLAAMSNVCFCIRPFVLHAMKQQKQKAPTILSSSRGSNSTHNNHAPPEEQQDDLHTFFLVTALAAFIILPGLVWILEGSQILRHYYGNGSHHSLYHNQFKAILKACLGFFAYQYTQLRVMSLTSPLAFSILTPVIKAVMILLCSLYFGDALGVPQIVGVVTTTSGGYWFTQAMTRMGPSHGSTPTPTVLSQPQSMVGHPPPVAILQSVSSSREDDENVEMPPHAHTQ